MIDVTCVGEALVDLVATVAGADVGAAPAFEKAAGGAPANVAVGVARLGRRSAFLGTVADDQFGSFLIRTLTENGVDTSFVRRAPGSSTGLAFVALGPGGERDFLFYRDRAADTRLRREDVSDDLLTRTRILHFGTFSLAAEPSRIATFHAVKLVRRRRVFVSLDVNLRPAIWEDLAAMRDWCWRAIGLADLVKLNDEELSMLTGESGYAGLREVARRGPRAVILTQGDRGCRALVDDRPMERLAFAVEPVDTTGAGDGFVAGLLVGLLERTSAREPFDLPTPEEVGEALEFANAVGALTTTRRGAIPALPTLEDVRAFQASANRGGDLPIRSAD